MLKMEKYRKRSVVWSYFRDIDAGSVQCLLCSRYLHRRDHGSTTPMLRHLRLKHSAEVRRRQIAEEAESEVGQNNQSMELDSDQIISVVVEMDEEDSHTKTQLNDSDVNLDVSGDLEPLEEGPAERLTHSRASDVCPVRNTRRRSLIWRLFEHLDSLNAARCRICMKKLHESGGISNLRRHLMKRHPKVLSELQASSHQRPMYLQHSNVAMSCRDFLGEENQQEPVKVVLVDGDSEIISELTPTENSVIDDFQDTLEEDSALDLKLGQKTTHAEGSDADCGTGEISWDETQKWIPVSMQDGNSNITTPSNETDSSSTVNGQLDTVQEGSTQQAMPANESDQPAKPTRRRSLIWQHFEKLESLEAAQCRICKKKLQCFESGCTGNLHRHMSKRHPKVFNKIKSNQQQQPSQDSSANIETREDSSVTQQQQIPGGLKVSTESGIESRVFKQERELIEALRRTQREESRTLEHQRELLEKLRAVSTIEAAAEKEKIESLRKAQQEEAEELRRQREVLEKEKVELQRKWEELHQERVELLLLSKDKGDS